MRIDGVQSRVTLSDGSYIKENTAFEGNSLYVDQVVDLATAAESLGELRAEIAILEDLSRRGAVDDSAADLVPDA